MCDHKWHSICWIELGHIVSHNQAHLALAAATVSASTGRVHLTAWALGHHLRCAGSQQDRIKAVRRRTNPLSHSTSFHKAPGAGGSALPTPATYSGRYAKQPSMQPLRHSTGSLKATLRQAAHLRAEHAGQSHAAKHAPSSSKEAIPSVAAVAELTQGDVSAKHARRAKQAQGVKRLKAGPAADAAVMPNLTRGSSRASAVHAGHLQPADAAQPAQHMPGRLAADPDAANDLASTSGMSTQASLQATSSPWSSKSPSGRLSALERMLQALPERGPKRGLCQHDQVGLNCKLVAVLINIGVSGPTRCHAVRFCQMF